MFEVELAVVHLLDPPVAQEALHVGDPTVDPSGAEDEVHWGREV